jgi:hypothetical protein
LSAIGAGCAKTSKRYCHAALEYLLGGQALGLRIINVARRRRMEESSEPKPSETIGITLTGTRKKTQDMDHVVHNYITGLDTANSNLGVS